MFLVFITHHSKIRELSYGNKNQTHFSVVGPTIFELWMIETELWAMETTNPNNPSLHASVFMRNLSYFITVYMCDQRNWNHRVFILVLLLWNQPKLRVVNLIVYE